MLPWARFLTRRGIAILGYDKRGVGGSTGTGTPPRSTIWPGDVVAAF
jgi:alpha-beta hydrolase superfamily lysophospholipase